MCMEQMCIVECFQRLRLTQPTAMSHLRPEDDQLLALSYGHLRRSRTNNPTHRFPCIGSQLG